MSPEQMLALLIMLTRYEVNQTKLSQALAAKDAEVRERDATIAELRARIERAESPDGEATP